MAIATGMAVADLLVEAGIITNPRNVRKVTLTFGINDAVTATVEQFVDRDAVETITKRLRVIEP